MIIVFNSVLCVYFYVVRRIFFVIFLVIVLNLFSGVKHIYSCSYAIRTCDPSGVCYNGGELCNGCYTCNPAAPYDCVSVPDEWLSCDLTKGVPTTAPRTCPIGTYACNVDSVPGSCCSFAPPTDPPAPPGCSASCNYSYCGFGDNGCGGSCICNECQMCTIACGQAKDCGGNCANTDAGVPAAPTLVSPAGTVGSPSVVADTTPMLLWNALGAATNADRYYVELVNGSDVVIWSTYVDGIGSTGIESAVTLTAGSTYHWRVRGENITCGTELGTWSSYGYMRTNTTPTISSLVIKNSALSAVSYDVGSTTSISNSVCPGGAVKYYRRTDRATCEATTSNYGENWLQCGGSNTCAQNLAAFLPGVTTGKNSLSVSIYY